MKSYTTVKNKFLRNRKTKAAYEKLGPEFELIQMIIAARNQKGLTQAELARKLGTKQSAISRLERGAANPSLEFLRKLAEALGTELQVTFS